MPSQSKAQQKFMGMVHALQKGDIEPSSVSKSVRDVANNMKKSDAKDFASTKHKGLPRKVKQEILNKLKEYANKMGTDHLGGDDYTSKRKGGLRDFDGYDNVDYNKDIPMDEARRSVVHKAVKKGSFPVTLVVVKNGKVVDQELVKTPEAVPAAFNVIQSKHKGATVHIEDRTGKRLFSESVNEGFKSEYEGNDNIIWKKGKTRGGVTNFTPYYKGHNIDKGGHNFKTEKELKDFIKDYILSNQLYRKYRNESKLKGQLAGDSVQDIIKSIGSRFVSGEIKNTKRDGKTYIKLKDKKFGSGVVKILKSRFGIDAKIDYYGGKGKVASSPSVSFFSDTIIDESKGVPQNYMQGRTSDYHTALRGKNRDYSGGTNFKKTNHGHPDIENAEEDEEVGLTNKQSQIKVEQSFKVAGRPVKLNKGKKKNGTDWTVTFKNGKTVPLSDVLSLIKPLPKLTKEEMGNLSSSERLELYKLYSKAMKAMPGSPNQKKIKVLINKLRKKADLKPLPVSEYGQRLDLSFIADEEARLKGTPEDKDAIDRDIDEYSNGSYEYTKGDQFGQNSVDEGIMIRLAGKLAQELLPKDVWYRHAKDPKKNKEFVKTVVSDLARTLNRFYKSHNINVKIQEQYIQEIGVFNIQNYVKGIVPASFFDTTTRDKKEKLRSTLRDLKMTLNKFWKSHNIPYRIK